MFLFRGRVRRAGRRNGYLERGAAHPRRTFRRRERIGRLFHVRPHEKPQRAVQDRRFVRLGGERPRKPRSRKRGLGFRSRAARRRTAVGRLPGADRGRRHQPRPHDAVLHAPLPRIDPPQCLQRRERRVHGRRFQGTQEPLEAVHLAEQLGYLPHADPAALDAGARRGVRRGTLAPAFRRAVGRRLSPLGDGQHRDRHHAGRPHADPDRKRLGVRRTGLRPLPAVPDHAQERRGAGCQIAGRGGAPGLEAIPRKGVLQRFGAARIHLVGLRHRAVRAARLRRRIRQLALFPLRPLVEKPLQPPDRLAAVAQCRRVVETARRRLARIDL